MKILLVQPRKSDKTIGGEDLHMFEPLSLEYVGAGVLEDGHDVRLLDLRLEDELESTLASFQPDVVGTTAFTVHSAEAKALCRRTKAAHPSATTVVGGHHATVMPADFRVSQVDVVVSGEGVFPFKELVRRLEAGEPLAGIPGVAWQTDGHWDITPEGRLDDIDTLPIPARSLTERYQPKYYSQWMHPMAAVVSSMGCPFRCTYCSIWRLNQGRRLNRSPERIVEELKTIEQDWIFFADYESLVDVKRMKALATAIAKSGLKKKYSLYSRSDTIVKHPELLEQWRDIGLHMVITGVEFFRDDDLKSVNKAATVRDNEQAAVVLRDLGITNVAYFLVRPEYDRSDFKELRAYIKRLNAPFSSFFVLTPLPGTALYDDALPNMIRTDPEFFDFFHTLLPTTLPLPEFYAELHRTWRSSMSPLRGLLLLRKFRLRHILPAILRMLRFYRRLKTAWRDYESPARHALQGNTEGSVAQLPADATGVRRRPH